MNKNSKNQKETAGARALANQVKTINKQKSSVDSSNYFDARTGDSQYDPFNPFNSMRILAQVNYWKPIRDGVIPPPVFVSVDPANFCDHDCVWCNSRMVKDKNTYMDEDYLLKLPAFLNKWGVKSVCMGGGGETLYHHAVGEFILGLADNDIELGVITNGTRVNDYLDQLITARWVGFSVDASTPKTYSKLHKTSENDFSLVLNNIEMLCNKGSKNNKFEVGYKFLVWPHNVHEIYDAAKIAKDLGVRRFQCRPASVPWYSKPDAYLFNEKQLAIYRDQIKQVPELNSHGFTAYCQKVTGSAFGELTKSYDENLKPMHNFSSCHVTYMQCIFEPNGQVSLCCDYRGNSSLILCNIDSPEEILNHWGTEHHKEIVENINVTKCPRCSYAPHNEIYEKVVEKDSMMINFV